jgi:hypothetical protein
MKKHARAKRFWLGLGLLLIVLIAGFAIANALIPGWGSTAEEKALVLPGDDLFASPVLKWSHALTIDAAPQQVWPWIAQMGDSRGGYYSYRYIEKAITAAAGVDTASYYPNTNSIHPEWQAPEPGQGMILDVTVLRDVKPGQYMVAGPPPEMSDAGLLWTWALAPTADGKTRLLVHMAIQIPGTAGNRIVEAALNLSTFMMERKMMEGIRLRAEGGSEPGWVQAAEAAIWFAVLLIGLAAAIRYIRHDDAKMCLWIGLSAVVLLFILVYLQPALWLRVALVLLLAGALAYDANWWGLRSKAGSAKPITLE